MPNPHFDKFITRKSAAKYEYLRRVEAMAFQALSEMKDHGIRSTDPDYRAVYATWYRCRRTASRMPWAEKDGANHV